MTTPTGESSPLPPPPSVVLYPSPGMDHLVSMFELAKLLVRLHGLSVTILIVEPHYNTGGATSLFISRVSSSNPSISFHRLPSITPPPNPSPHHEAHAFDLLRLSNPNLRSFLLSSPSLPRALVIDFFCIDALDVTADLNLPLYIFFTSGAYVLATFLHLPVLHDTSPLSFRVLGPAILSIPGVPPLPANHMPLPMLDRDDDAYKSFLHLSTRVPDVDGIITNTFDALERRAVEAIRSGDCVPPGRTTPPLYCIGPLITDESTNNKGGEECISWLDTQPEASVVFLCFGSLGVFSAEQLGEIATGLERSNQRFLWVVRSPKGNDPDLDVLLPSGFMSRTEGKGMVVKSWAPQAAVLKHKAVGGFVTHCGWNSVLEAICAGVPMIGWPLYAEQRMNKVFLVEDMRLAVEMKGHDEDVVKAEEVEEKVRWLMETDGGRELRERTIAAKAAAEEAVAEGGTSQAAVMTVVGEWRRGRLSFVSSSLYSRSFGTRVHTSEPFKFRYGGKLDSY